MASNEDSMESLRQRIAAERDNAARESARIRNEKERQRRG